MKTLRLTIKKQWFGMILSGEKKEEYREIKPFFISRLCEPLPMSIISGGNLRDNHTGQNFKFKHYDAVEFINGYSKDAPRTTFEFKGVHAGKGNPAWGAPDFDVFIIKLGNRL